MIDFGSVFRYREKEYVFLVQIDNLVYAAEILETDKGDMLRKYTDSASFQTKSERHKEMIQFCFVVLKTEQYSDRVAHLQDNDSHSIRHTSYDIICDLSEADKKMLKQEILNSEDHMPIQLIEFVKTLSNE